MSQLKNSDANSASNQFYWDPALGGNGHIYEFVSSTLNWAQASAAASGKTLGGAQEHLLTISSAAEQQFIVSQSAFNATGYWLGASDAASEGQWKWVVGPEAGTQFWNGSGTSGSAVSGRYQNWDLSPSPNYYGPQPDGGINENYAVLGGKTSTYYYGVQSPQKWLDAYGSDTQWSYIVEYELTGTATSNTPVMTSALTASISENVSTSTAVYTATGTDPDAGTTLTYSITGGADANLFNINSSTGAVTFKTSPNFEAPADSGANNVYDIVVQVSDGALTASQAVAITVSNANEAPSVTSGSTATTPENVSTSTAVYTATGTDPDVGTTLTYSITGGADANLFNINSSTGAVTFKTSPNFEAPADSGANNVYDIVVQVSDGALTASQAVAITVTDVAEGNSQTGTVQAPSVTSGSTATTPENVSTSTAVYTATGTDPDAGTTLTYSITGGADANLFNINSSTGAVTFKTSPNFEAPADSGANNVYDIVVQVSDGTLTASQAVAITVSNANEAPSVTSGSTATTPENVSTSTAVYTATGTDPDAGTTLTYSITGGADANLFNINSSTGAVTFKTSPNFEAPADSGANNVYDIVVQVSDGALTASQAVAITVSNANEAPRVTSGSTATTPENVSTTTAVYTATGTDPDAGTTLTYSITGGADANLFNINSSTGAVTFKTSPNFEAPADSGANNVYDIVVQVSDGALTASQAVAITVTDVAEGSSSTNNSVAGTLIKNFACTDAGNIAFAIQADGKIVAASSTSAGQANSNFCIARYRRNA
jgi:hypothetical protein